MVYVDHLRLSGLKSELVKDRYVVLCTVTMTTQKHKTKQKQNTKATKSTHKQNTKNNNQTKQETNHTSQKETVQLIDSSAMDLAIYRHARSHFRTQGWLASPRLLNHRCKLATLGFLPLYWSTLHNPELGAFPATSHF